MNMTNNEKLNTALYEKMFAELEKYRDWLLSQPPEEILEHTYEYTIRKDILTTLEVNNISDVQASALLKSPAPLGDIFEEFEKQDTGYLDIVRDCMTDRANLVIKAEREQRKILLSTPVYKYPASYARENNELEIYRASHKANIACRDAIDNSIRDNYRDNCLGADSAKQVISEFGYDRTLYVLANTVREKEWDGRIDHKNKDWARTVPIFEDNDAFGDNRNREFVVGQSHPGLLNLFVNQARHEYLLSQPLTKEDIQAEAVRILGKLQDAHEPNSPNGTHFIAEVSKDFMLRANSKDTDKLFALLPFQSLSLSTLNDRKGVYAIISKDENRSQPLQKRKPSVRNKLQKAASTTKPPATAKSKDMEL